MDPLSPFLQTALALAIIIVVSKAAGAISKRFGQPAVFGEILVGVLLGPTLVNMVQFFPDSEHVHILIKDLAELGVVVLMFLAGLETDLGEMRKVGVAALVSATGGVLLPLAAGTGISLAFGFGIYESVFIGTILTATSVSISAQTLLEMGQLRSKAGTTILGAAVIDDVMGIVLLSVVVALHGAGSGTASTPVWMVLVQMGAFFAVAIAAGKYVVPGVLRFARRWPGEEVVFAVALALGLVFAVGSEVFGKVAAITGAYALGVMIAQHHDLREVVTERLKILGYGFLVPVFFVSIGLEGNLIEALRSSGAAYMVLIVVAAVVTKIVGAGLGARLASFTPAESLKVGIGMISRGEVALIVAGIGLGTGVISTGTFSVMIVMTLITTLITPLLLRRVFPRTGAENVG